MSATHRYRISVTPIERDGCQCPGRCSIEFDQASAHDWMQQLEQLQQLRVLGCGQDAALVLAHGLLDNLASTARKDAAHVLAALQPQLDQLLCKLQALQQAR